MLNTIFETSVAIYKSTRSNMPDYLGLQSLVG